MDVCGRTGKPISTVEERKLSASIYCPYSPHCNVREYYFSGQDAAISC